MIRLNLTKADIQSDEELFRQVKIALSKHTSEHILSIQKDKDYYFGNLPKYDYTINKAKYIVDSAAELFIGTPPDITTTEEEDTERVVALNKKLKVLNFPKAISSVGLETGMCGVGYMLTYTEDGDEFPRFVSLDSESTNVVYDTAIEPHSLFGFTISKETNYSNNSVGTQFTNNSYYKAYVYTDEYYYEMRTASSADLSITGDYVKTPHFFGRVPITEFKNNEQCYGDARPVYKLLDAYNKLENDRIQNVSDSINYLLLLQNVRIGNETEQTAFTDLLKNERVLAIEGEGTNAKFLSNPLDQTQLQTLASDLENNSEQISRVPNLTSPSFAQNSSEPALKLKLKGFLDLAKGKERFFTPSFMRVLKMIMSFLERFGGEPYAKYHFDIEGIELKYSHQLPSNDQEMITQIMNLYAVDQLNPSVALQQISWIDNVQSYQDGVVKKVVAPATSFGNNATNIERQNEVPQEVKQMDNKDKFNRGNSQRLVEEKEEVKEEAKPTL